MPKIVYLSTLNTYVASKIMFKSVTTCFSDAPIIGLTMGNKYPSFLCINIGLLYVRIRIKLLADIIARHAVTNLLLLNF